MFSFSSAWVHVTTSDKCIRKGEPPLEKRCFMKKQCAPLVRYLYCLVLWDFSLLGEKSQASMHFDRIIPCSDYITPFLCCDLIWSMMIQQTSSWIPYTQFRWGMKCKTSVICLWDSYLVACRSHRKNLVSTDTCYALKKQSSLSCILAQNM